MDTDTATKPDRVYETHIRRARRQEHPRWWRR